MDKTTLVKDDVNDGRELLKTLDERGDFEVNSALWFYFPEFEEWRLVLASKYVDKFGPRKSYGLIQKTLEEYEPQLGLTLRNISVVGVDNELIRLLRVFITTDKKEISDIRIKNSSINGTMIEDALLYRVSPSDYS